MGRLTVTGLLTLLATISTNGQTTTASNTAQQSTSGGHAEIIIRDSTRYSPAFLSGLRESISGASQPYAGMYRLEDNLLIVDTDTLGFPEDLPLHRKFVFAGRDSKQSITLSLTRVNYTTVKYAMKRYRHRKLIDNRSGMADLSPLFWLGSEVDEESDTGTSYLSSEYRDIRTDDSISIRVGVNEEGRLQVFVTVASVNPEKTLNLDKSPILRQQ